MDLDGYFDHQYAQIIANALDEASEAAETSAHRAQLRWEDDDWARAKQELIKHRRVQGGREGGREVLELALAREDGREGAIEVAAEAGLSAANALRLARGTSRLTDTQRRYAKATSAATEGGREGGREQGLCQRLLSVAKGISRLGGREGGVVVEDQDEFRRTLELLRNMLEKEEGERYVPAVPSSFPHSTALEGEGGNDGEEEEEEEEEEEGELWKAILPGRARIHLELDFAVHVQRKVDRVRAERGGEGGRGGGATMEEYVKNYGKGGRGEREGGDEDWVYEVLYYSLRAGGVERAVEYVVGGEGGARGIFPEVRAVLLDLWKGGREGGREGGVEEGVLAVRALAAQREGLGGVFEKAVLNLLGFVNGGRLDKKYVVRTTEDYLWWSLWFCSVGPTEGGREGRREGLWEEVAGRVLRWGEAHFDREGEKAFLYCRVLFCVGMFEEGVRHVAKSKHGEATHLAIVLSHYNLLTNLTTRGTSPSLPSSSSSSSSSSSLLEMLVVSYIKDFWLTDPTYAADYLLFLRPAIPRMEAGLEALLLAQEDDAARSLLASHLKGKTVVIHDLISTTGRTRMGERTRMWKRYVWNETRAKMVLRRAGMAAEALDARKALMLYVLCEDYRRAMGVMNKQVALLLLAGMEGRREGGGGGRDEWWGLMEREGRGLADKLDKEGGGDGGRRVKKEFELLVGLRRWWEGERERGEGGRKGAGLAVIYDELRLFPRRSGERDGVRAMYVLQEGSDEMKRVMACVAVKTMQALYGEWRGRKRQREEGGREAGNEGGLMEVREKGRALVELVMGARKEMGNDALASIQRYESMMI